MSLPPYGDISILLPYGYIWPVCALEPGKDGEPHLLRTDGGDVRARTVVIASGVEYRKLPVESLEALTGTGSITAQP